MHAAAHKENNIVWLSLVIAIFEPILITYNSPINNINNNIQLKYLVLKQKVTELFHVNNF